MKPMCGVLTTAGEGTVYDLPVAGSACPSLETPLATFFSGAFFGAVGLAPGPFRGASLSLLPPEPSLLLICPRAARLRLPPSCLLLPSARLRLLPSTHLPLTGVGSFAFAYFPSLHLLLLLRCARASRGFS